MARRGRTERAGPSEARAAARPRFGAGRGQTGAGLAGEQDRAAAARHTRFVEQWYELRITTSHGLCCSGSLKESAACEFFP